MSSTADTSYKTTGGRQTKFASIPEPPAGASPELKKWMAAVKETVEVREGKRGNSLDRSIIVRDLFDPDFTTKYWPDGSSNNPNLSPGASQKDTKAPGPVGNFEIDASGSAQNILTWTNPTDGTFAHVEIFGVHIYGIPTWSSDGSYPLNELIRYGIYVYKVIDVDPHGTGTTRLTGISPDDPEYGGNGSVAPCWMRQGYPYRTVANAGPLAIIHSPTETWIHGLTGEALSQDWYYYARAVDDAGNESPWNPDGGEGLFALAKTNVGITPDPQNLMICETGSTTEFNDLNVHLCWSPSTKYGVKDYTVKVYTTSTMAERRIVENIRGMAWTYEYNDNKIDGSGTAEDSLTFRLWAVDIYGSISEGYDEISVVNPAPAPVIIDAKAIMQGVRFSWDPSPETDFSHYVYRIRVETGVWSNWAETSVSIVDRFLTPEENALYTGEAQIYIEVYVVDTWGNVSTTAAANEESISFIVKPHNIDDFAVNASKIWVNLPVLEGDVWYANSPSSGYVRWEAHRLYLNGVKYDIAAGSTNRKYIYWVKPNTTYSSSDNNPKGGTKEGVEYPDLLGNNGWVIAVNTSGVYDLAWNAIANQIIGSAYIEDASIVSANIGELQVNNAHVYGDLDASKIISGLLISQNWPGAGSQFSLNDGTFKLGGSTDPSLEWDGSQLTLKGAIMQSGGGDTFPLTVYRGAWSSGTTYYQADMVTYQGSSWVCIAGNTNIAPDVVSPGSSYWEMSAAKGDDGAAGASGSDGVGGVYQGEWVTGRYYYGSSLRKDIVKHGGTYYICQVSHASSATYTPGATTRWATFGATFSSVATDLVLANDITVLRSIVFGDPGTKTGVIRSYGKDTYADTTPGFFIGYDVTDNLPKVNIGDNTHWLKWTGYALSIGGDIIATGNIQGNAVSQMLVDTNSSNYMALTSFFGTWLILASITMTVDDSDGSGVLLTGSTTVYGSAGHRPIFVQWVDETPGVGSPTYQLGIHQEGSGVTHFAIGKWGVPLTQVTIEDVTGICPMGYDTKSILTGLRIKR